MWGRKLLETRESKILLRLTLLSAAMFLSAVRANAADVEWRWVWTTPDYIRTDNSPTWSSESGTAKVIFHGGRFSAHLENAHNDPAYNLVGHIVGHRVTATAQPTDSDETARHCSGTIGARAGMKIIALLCEDGEFIGLNRPQP